MLPIYRRAILILALLLLDGWCAGQTTMQPAPQSIVIDLNGTTQPFPHFWEQMFGSGRAILALREDYRRDLRSVKKATGFQYVRFHAIFHDEVGVYSEDAQGRPQYNFSYVDQIYDGLLADGVKPFVELSFMPRDLAAKEVLHPFWYKPNTSPPKDWLKWEGLVSAFATHLIQRYGAEEISQWYFEVWNEPNLDFWSGEPKQATYWELYDHTARALKSVNSKLRVGGPATAQAAWVDAFIRHCAENHVPVDFVSSHVYGDDSAQDVFGTKENIPRDQMVCRSVKKVHEQIEASPMPTLPLIWSEFNATFRNESQITDSSFMGPWLADTIRQCSGLTEMMSYWAFSDVFEEQGVVKTPFYGGYGLIAERGIPKPAYNAFRALRNLGEQRLPVNADSVLATRRSDRTFVIAVWNYAAPEEKGAPRIFNLSFSGASVGHASILRVDDDHGNAQTAYSSMGSPRYPTLEQIALLRKAAELPAPENLTLNKQQFDITIPPHGLAVIEVR